MEDGEMPTAANVSRDRYFLRVLFRVLAPIAVGALLLIPTLGCGGNDEGGFKVSRNEVRTGIQAQAGSVVHISSTGTVDFGGAVLGGGAPKLNADGDEEFAPTTYPAPELRKNSLIVKVGSIWYQGGTDQVFRPSESGEIVLAPNDDDPGNNSRGWRVNVTIDPPPTTGALTYGPLPVRNRDLMTGISADAGSTIRIISSGTIDFGGAVLGGGAPKLNADGDEEFAPATYPAPELRKNSLIIRVGSLWYQGGVGTIFAPTESGSLVLATNDDDPGNNSRGWHVTITIDPPPPLGSARTYGPLPVSNRELKTAINVDAASSVHILATGIVDFGGAVLGGGAPKLNADGDEEFAPASYPAPELRKNSLIARVSSLWYQGGQTANFVPTQSGQIILAPNDDRPQDNSRGWHVTITIAPPPAPNVERVYGPLPVSNTAVDTALDLAAGSAVHVQASGLVDFGGAVLGGGAPKLNADGDEEFAPASYPAPELRKNSLIAHVGLIWYQGGQDARFSPTQSGRLVLAPNDDQPQDNTRGWRVSVAVAPPTAIPTYGPIPISNAAVQTGISVRSGSVIRLQSDGKIDFGGFLGIAPKLDADGENGNAPGDYPAPGLRKNSLIARVGSIWSQGGVDASFTATEDGELLLQPNDARLADNSRGWHVRVTVTPPR
jgi:hypothetical protein